MVARDLLHPRRQDGFTLIEVLVAALILLLVSSGAALAFTSSLHASGDQRIRSEAQALAHRDENRLRGMDIDQLSNLNQTVGPITLNGTDFTIAESASYISDANGVPSCQNPSADYLKTTSTVTWNDIGAAAPVTLTSILTPALGSVDPSHGTLAVLVIDAAGAGVPNVQVAINGPTTGTETETTGGNGCVLFGDLPADTYSVSAAPQSGTDVDAQSGAPVSLSSPDVVSPSPTVSSGKTVSTQLQIDTAGTARFNFTTLYPAGVTPSSPVPSFTPGVVLANSTMNAPGYRLCTDADTTGCPAVGQGDTSFGQAAWPVTQGGPATVSATPLFPFNYAAYPGVCSSDEPIHNGGGKTSDTAVRLTSGGPPVTSVLALPAIVVRLYSGTTVASPEISAAGGRLVVTDTGCVTRYIGYSNGATPPAVTSGQSILPLNSGYGAGLNDTGLLTYPGMPWGTYTVCYAQGGRSYTAPAFTNRATPGGLGGEVVNLFAGSAKPGTC